MNFIVIEDKRFTLRSVLSDIKAKFPSSSILNVTSKNSLNSLRTLKTTPILSEKWCVVINPVRMGESHLKELLLTDNYNIVYINSKTRANEIVKTVSKLGIQFKLVDSTNISKNEMISYVSEKLNVELDIAKYICNRHKYYFPKVMESILVLQSLGKIDRAQVKRYTESVSDVTFSDVVNYLLKYNPKDGGKGITKFYKSIPRERIVKLVYKYRYGFDFFLSFIKKEINHILEIHSWYIAGDLSLANVVDFHEEHKNDDLFKIYSPYHLKRFIDIYENVSIDYIFFINISLSKIPNSTVGILDFLNLLKLGG